MTNTNDQVTVREIIQFDGALTQTDSAGQPDAGWPVAHIRAVREIAAAVFAGEQLVKKRGFIGGTPGGIKFHAFRGVVAAQAFADFGKCHLPFDGLPGVGDGVVLHRMR